MRNHLRKGVVAKLQGISRHPSISGSSMGRVCCCYADGCYANLVFSRPAGSRPAGFGFGLRIRGHLRLLRESILCFVSRGFRLLSGWCTSRALSGPLRDTPPYRAIPFRDSIAEGAIARFCLVFIGYCASIAEIPF